MKPWKRRRTKMSRLQSPRRPMSDPKIHMVNGRVLVRPISANTDRKTVGGLFVPDSAGDQVCRGEVIAFDRMEWDHPDEEGFDIHFHPHCLYLKGGGYPYKDNLFLVQKEAVLAFVAAD